MATQVDICTRLENKCTCDGTPVAFQDYAAGVENCLFAPTLVSNLRVQ